MNTIRIFPNGQVEVGNGKPGYDWHPAWSQKHDDGSVSQPLILSEWRAIAKRDGAKLVKFASEKGAAQLAEALQNAIDCIESSLAEVSLETQEAMASDVSSYRQTLAQWEGAKP